MGTIRRSGASTPAHLPAHPGRPLPRRGSAGGEERWTRPIGPIRRIEQGPETVGPDQNRWGCRMNTAYMPSGSMEPTRRIGDRYLVDKMAFRVTGIHRNDIVTVEVRQPDFTPESRRFVKRVLDCPVTP